MIEVLDYLKNFLFPTNLNRKKRRLTLDEIEIPVKIRRMSRIPQLDNSEDDWHLSTSLSNNKRRSIYSAASTSIIDRAKENIVYNIDDDDVLEVAKPKETVKPKSSQFTSTPNTSIRSPLAINGDDDITIVKCTESASARRNNARKVGLDYINRFSSLHDSQNVFRRPQSMSRIGKYGSESATPQFDSAQGIRSKLNIRNPSIHSSALDQSYRLDEKLKFKELLSKAAPSFCSSNMDRTFSKYSTPCGKLFIDPSSRAGTMVNLARRHENKPPLFIDLTEDTDKKTKIRLSTKDTIKKVLDDLDSETVVVKDSDSEVEIISTPSPKPDIKVEPVNSLKKVIDTTEHAHVEWLKNIIEKHNDEIARREREIEKQKVHAEKFGPINDAIRVKMLEDKIKRSLQIKETVLLADLSEEPSLPTLTDEQETVIAKALNARSNPNEVLVQKFNLSITRRDLMTLSGLNWLNDEVINFYMNLIIERGKLPQWSNVYAMNTFFYPKLLKDGPASLRRWTRKVDIFSYDLIAVPIHLGVHWCMSVIDFTSKTIKYYDSMGGTNRRCLESLLKYLQAEHVDKKKNEFDISGWELENVKEIPQQMNGSDCGMFACTFAEFLTRNAKITFSQEDMPYLRRKMVLEIVTGNLLIT